MTEALTLDQQVLETIFHGKLPPNVKLTDPENGAPPYSTNMDWSYTIIKFHQHSGWQFGVKAIHYDTGDLQYRVRFSKKNAIAETLAGTMEEAICESGLLVSREAWIEFSGGDDSDEDEFQTVVNPHGTIEELSIEEHDEVYNMFLDTLKSGTISITDKDGQANDVTLLELVDHARQDGLISLGDVGGTLDNVVSLFQAKLKDSGLHIVKIKDKDE